MIIRFAPFIPYVIQYILQNVSHALNTLEHLCRNFNARLVVKNPELQKELKWLFWHTLDCRVGISEWHRSIHYPLAFDATKNFITPTSLVNDDMMVLDHICLLKLLKGRATQSGNNLNKAKALF